METHWVRVDKDDKAKIVVDRQAFEEACKKEEIYNTSHVARIFQRLGIEVDGDASR